MGNQISDNPEYFLNKYYSQLSLQKEIANSTLVKTFMCKSQDQGYVIGKVIRFPEDQKNFNPPKSKIDINEEKLAQCPNLLPLYLDDSQPIEEVKNLFIGFRQYVYHSLLEKLRKKIPPMSVIEKHWLTFQLIAAINQLHQNEIYHGDIKPENILLTSYNHLFITDMVNYKPVYVSIDDLKTFKTYFGELDNTSRCYFAPERLVKKEELESKQEKPIEQDDGISMDIFSVGCVMAEIHMEGEVLFSRGRLINYKEKKLDPREILDQKINHKPTVDLIMRMIDLDPKQRPSVNECLDELTRGIVPHSFSRSLFQINSALTKPNFLFSDLRIGLIRKYMPSIYRACFDKNKSISDIQSMFFEPLERTIFEQLRQDGIQEYNSTLIPSGNKYSFVDLQGDFQDQQAIEKIQDPIEKQTSIALYDLKVSPQSSIVVIHWIGQFMSTCFFPQSRRVALELFLVIAKATSLEIRLQYILPYVFTMFNDPQQKVAAKAVEVSIRMFESLVDENEEDSQLHHLNSTDYNVFKGYIMKEFKQLSKKFKESKIIQLTYLRYLPLLAKIGCRFTEISGASRLKKQAINPKLNQLGSNVEIQNDQAALQPDDQAEKQVNENEGQIIEGQILGEDNQIPLSKIDSAQHIYNENKQANDQQNFSTSSVANFDKEIEELRKSFQQEIQEQIAIQDPSTQRLIYSKLGYLCDFFGSRMTIDFVSLQVTSILNSKEILVKLDSLQSFLGIAIKTGKQTLFEESLKIFLDDSEEIILIETIRVLNVLLRLGLLKKDNLLDEFVKKRQQNKGNQTFLQIMLPLLMHPNQWIRDEILQFIKTLSDFKRERSFLSKTDVICLLRRLIKPYLNDESQSLNFILEASTQDSSIQKLSDFLKKPLSRNYYEFIKRQSQIPKSLNQAGSVQLNMIALNNEDDTLKVSNSDKIALSIFQPRLDDIAENFAKQQQVFIQPGRSSQPAGVYQHSISQYRSQPSAFWKKLKSYNTYRVVQLNTLENLILQYQNIPLIQNKINNQEQISNKITRKVHNTFFEVCNRIQGSKDLNPFDSNNGICKALKAYQNQLNDSNSEIDYLMDQLELQEDSKVLKVESQFKDLFNRISNQSLPVDWLLQIEKLSDTIPQPTNLPYFSPKLSETTSVPIPKTKEASNFAQSISLGEMRTSLENFRPKGRLLTTLYEHSNPVTSLAISEDQSMFLTASRDDKQVKIWVTSDILKDSTSHSRNTITTEEKINQIAMIQNSDYVSVAQNKGRLDIYRIDRLQNDYQNQDQSRQFKSSLPEISYKQNINKNENDGDILNCLSSILPVSQQHMLFSSSQKGSIFMNDLRAPAPVLVNHGAIQQSRGMITCMELGQDPYQILCGTIGGYVLVYDVRFNMISTQYKHSQRSPINSIAIFKPSEKREFQQWTENEISKFYNMSNYQSPMVMVASGGASYELSLLNLDTGVLEILMTVNEDKDQDILGTGSSTGCGVQIPSYLRECLIRDAYSYPEKTETNQSLFRRYMNQAKGSLTSTSQIKLTQNLDDELFKASKLRYHLLSKASSSENACRKIIIPRKATSMLLSTQTVDYCITGGNDKRLRYWSLREPASLSYYINTPKSDECQYMSSAQAGGTLYIREQILQTETFPRVIANMFQPFTQKTDQKSKQFIRNGKIILNEKENEIELGGDSPYYQVLANIIQSQNGQDQQVIFNSKTSGIGVSGMVLGYTTSGVTSSSGNQYQVEMKGVSQKPTVFNLNGLSEWQHFNGVNLTEGNAIINNNTYSDKWSSSSSAGAAAAGMLSGQYQPNSYKRSRRDSLFDKGSQSRQARHRGSSMNGEIYENSPQITRDYMYQDTLYASHSDSILDLGVIELDSSSMASQSQGELVHINSSYLSSSKIPILISCGRDGQVKLWQ